MSQAIFDVMTVGEMLVQLSVLADYRLQVHLHSVPVSVHS